MITSKRRIFNRKEYLEETGFVNVNMESRCKIFRTFAKKVKANKSHERLCLILRRTAKEVYIMFDVELPWFDVRNAILLKIVV